jgi:hypothetical protein
MKHTPAEVVIAHFGVRPLARLLGVSHSAPIQWRKRGGLIPSQYHQLIIKESQGRITPNDVVYGR